MASLSVITACFNSEKTIEGCIRSRIRCVGSSVDHVIQDGQSEDETLKVIESIADTAIEVESAKDRGIYDALNKAIERAKGEWIVFLHSDDRFVYSNLMSDLDAAEASGVTAVAYGVRFRRPAGEVFRVWNVEPYDQEEFRYGFMLPHTGLVVRKRLFEQYGAFRLDMGSAADYEWILRVIYKHEQKPLVMSGKILTEMAAGGASDAGWRARIRANYFDRMAWTVNGIKPSPFFRVLKPVRKLRQLTIAVGQ